MQPSGDALAAPRRVRALVVYHHRIVERVLTHLLTREPIQILDTVQPGEISTEFLDRLKPDVLVVDREAWIAEGGSYAEALLDCCPEVPLRLVLVDLTDDTLALWQREPAAKANAATLIRMVLGDKAADALPPTAA